MNLNFLKNKVFFEEIWYFLSAILVISLIIELVSPSLLLIYINPLFFLVLWLIVAFYLLIKK